MRLSPCKKEDRCESINFMYEQIIAFFPQRITPPLELKALANWVETNGYLISGYFRLEADKYESIKHWFGNDLFSDRFGVFGSCPDGSLYAIWLQDDGQQHIVHLDSEGVNNFVLATNFVDFLRILAIGYDEIGFSDLSKTPFENGCELESINLSFRRWVAATFDVNISATAELIVSDAAKKSQNFQEWIDILFKKVG